MSIDIVKDYYGKTLQTSADLKTEACCSPDAMPAYVKRVLSNIHDEVLAKYYGCGLVTPLALEGARILDLGSGSGDVVSPSPTSQTCTIDLVFAPGSHSG